MNNVVSASRPDCARCSHWAIAHGFGGSTLGGTCGECRILNRSEPCPGYVEPEPVEANASMRQPMLFGCPVVVDDFYNRRRDGGPYEWRLRPVGAAQGPEKA